MTVRKGENVIISCISGYLNLIFLICFRVSSPASFITITINGAATRLEDQIERRQTKGFVTEANITINTNNLLSVHNQINVECKARNGRGASSTKQHIIRILCKFLFTFIHF